MRFVAVAVSLCCLIAGPWRAADAAPAPAPTSGTTPATTTPAPTPAPTTTPASTPASTVPASPSTSQPRSPSTPPSTTTPTATELDPVAGAPADTVAQPSGAAQTAARSALANLTDAQRGLLRRLQDARDQLAAARVAALAAATDATEATARATAAQAAAERAQTAADTGARTLARTRAEIRELAGAVYQHLDRTAPLADVDTTNPVELARARVYSMAPSDRLVAAAERATAAARRLAAARDRARLTRDEVTQLAAAADAALARQRQAVADAETADSIAVAFVTEALGSGAALLTEVADPHFGADAITAALATAQVGQDDPATAFGLFRSPVPGAALGSPYGMRVDPLSGTIGYHPGIDFEAGAGEAIHAAAAGVVVIAGDCGGYGNCVVLDHGHSMATVYAHQSRVLVTVGEQVADGQVLGLVGSTGKSTGPHLHFEVRFHGDPVDPVPTLTS